MPMGAIGRRSALFGIVFGLTCSAQGFAKADSGGTAQPVFARVNGEVVLQGSYETALRVAGRQRFYHGKAPEAELIEFRKEVAERLIDERILHQEARRRGMAADQNWVEAEFAKIERRYSASPQWHESADTLKQQIRDGLEERNLVQQLDEALREVPPPAEHEVRAYYAANPDKFTSPEQIRVSSILLKVEPWQPKDVWDHTTDTAEQILAELRVGADFSAYAQKYPPLDKAQLGYIHRGMLGEAAQVEIDKLKPGEITPAVTLLEGVGIFRLEERVPARLNPLEKVRDRAAALLAREQSEAAYARRVSELRSGASITFVDPNYFRTPTAVTLQDASHRGASPIKNE